MGVLFCRAGQSTEEDNSDSGSPALDQFLDLLGHRGPLKDTSGTSTISFSETKPGPCWSWFCNDVRMVFGNCCYFLFACFCFLSEDSTGRQSVFTTFREFKLMFHVSTASSPQQVILLFLVWPCAVYCTSTTTKVFKYLYFISVFVFLTAFYFYSPHFNTNISSSYFIHFPSVLLTLGLTLTHIVSYFPSLQPFKHQTDLKVNVGPITGKIQSYWFIHHKDVSDKDKEAKPYNLCIATVS